MIEAGLCLFGLDVASDEAAVRALARALRRAGKVTAGFEAAAVARERRSPTGLPFAGGAIAIPHAEPEHVEAPATAIAKLARPVKFREMGNPASRLDVALVIMPALTAREQAAAGLARLIDVLQDEASRRELRAAVDATALLDVLSRRWAAA
ncbi:MAG TPA: PTS sugar transporter subunit IIA [Polyangiaceae bacterium]|nr:PTS sugar transporter subunit IIA [Polyangiaceae bacterium]